MSAPARGSFTNELDERAAGPEPTRRWLCEPCARRAARGPGRFGGRRALSLGKAESSPARGLAIPADDHLAQPQDRAIQAVGVGRWITFGSDHSGSLVSHRS
jgi:hypothetical protein